MTSESQPLTAEYITVSGLIVDVMKGNGMIGAFLQDHEWKRCHDVGSRYLQKGINAAMQAINHELQNIQPYFFGDK